MKKNYVALGFRNTEEELLESIQTMVKGGRADGFLLSFNSKKKDRVIDYLQTPRKIILRYDCKPI